MNKYLQWISNFHCRPSNVVSERIGSRDVRVKAIAMYVPILALVYTETASERRGHRRAPNIKLS